MSIEPRRDVFQAIADPTRRQIIELLAEKEMNLNAISDQFDISRPAISQHIKILNECGIVEIEQIGRERFCKIQPRHLKEAADWIQQYTVLWEQKINSFERYVNKLQTKKKKNEQTRRSK